MPLELAPRCNVCHLSAPVYVAAVAGPEAVEAAMRWWVAGGWRFDGAKVECPGCVKERKEEP